MRYFIDQEWWRIWETPPRGYGVTLYWDETGEYMMHPQTRASAAECATIPRAFHRSSLVQTHVVDNLWTLRILAPESRTLNRDEESLLVPTWDIVRWRDMDRLDLALKLRAAERERT